MSGILALDIGRATGWAVTTADGRIRDSGTIRLAKRGRDPITNSLRADARHARRLAEAVEALVQDHQPDVLVLEAVYAAPRRGAALRKLLVLRGAALAGALRARPELHLVEAPIRAWQTWAAGAINWRKLAVSAEADRRDAEAMALWAAATSDDHARRPTNDARDQ